MGNLIAGVCRLRFVFYRVVRWMTRQVVRGPEVACDAEVVVRLFK